MPRPRPADAEMIGQDSFLDVVANMVGIIIILVIIVGMRVKNAAISEAPPAEIPAAAPGEKQLAASREEAAAIEHDVRRLHAQSQEVSVQLAQYDQERSQLATLLAAAKEEVERRRQALDGDSRADFDLRRAFLMARSQLDQLQQRKQSLENAPGTLVTVQSLPTPISKTVFQQEVHFQLSNNRIVQVPLDELVEAFKKSARSQWQDEHKYDGDVLTDEIGPIGNFRLRYHLGRTSLPTDGGAYSPNGYYAELIRFEVIPDSTNLGEPASEALRPQSRLRAVLSRYEPGKTTVTVWTYPDSFAAFRQLKSELFALGYATAARPLPEGEYIGGSPDGSRSAAQ